MNMLMKTLTATGVLILGMVACSNMAAASSFEEMVGGVYKLYINGELMGTDATLPHCSAVAVSENQLVTAAHCVDMNNIGYSLRLDNEVWNNDGELETLSFSTVMVERVRTIKNLDVAFIELKDDSIKLSPVDIAEEFEPKIGDELMAVGFPMADQKTITKGLFTALSPLDALGLKGPFYKTTIPVTGGNSGGGLFHLNGNEYELVGITSAMRPSVSFMSYFSPLSSTHKIIDNLINKDNEDMSEEEVEVKKSSMRIDDR